VATAHRQCGSLKERHRPGYAKLTGNVTRMSTFSTNGDIGATAVVVAKFRAIETARSDRLFSDPLAEVLVAEAEMPEMDGITRDVIEVVPMLRRVYEATIVRTRYLDDHLLSAVQDGCRQVVLLAAGLDTRAYRLPVGGDVTFYELDLPKVLEFKKSALERHEAQPLTERVAVAADLTESWAEPLTAAGFDPAIATTWMAEGIMMYFTQEQNDALLKVISEMSARGSRFLFVANGPGWLADDSSKDLKATVDQAGVGFKSHVDDPETWLHPAGWAVHTADTLENFGTQFGRGNARPGDDDGPVRSWAVDAIR
jgi:methyltransferase (TIGR00027 family)